MAAICPPTAASSCCARSSAGSAEATEAKRQELEARFEKLADRTTAEARTIRTLLDGQPVPWPYGGWHLEAMDAHGGWIGSAPDLVRLAMSLEPCRCASPLNADSLRTMWSRPTGEAGLDKEGKPNAAYYGCGWFVREIDSANKKFNVWHTGSLDGTSTLLVRRHDGFCWAVLFNSRHGFNPETKNFDVTPSGAIDPLIHQAVDAVSH